ncbi:hypothetical protein MMC25_000489 [Agyrium rufum]|nr:hypothetical protein [Agyrium rufum]
MEALTVASSIAGLVGLAEMVAYRLAPYVRAMRHASEQISALLLQTSKLHGVLQSLKFIAEQYEVERVSYVQTHHLDSCFRTLEKIRESLGDVPLSRNKNKLAHLKMKLKWSLSQSDTTQLIKELEEHQSTLSLALSTESYATLLASLGYQKDIGAAIDEIKTESRLNNAKIGAYLDREERQRLLLFFENDGVSPRQIHDTNLMLLQSGTGGWLLDSEEFRSWLNTESARLWIYGIPGAGKTIMMALAILQIPDLFEEDHILAYYYCDYKDTATQDQINISGSLAKRIALQDAQAFWKLEEFYHRSSGEEDASQPRNAIEIRDLLMAMMAHLPTVFIIVGGLDECATDRHSLIQLLNSLSGAEGTDIRLLFASSDEHDIRPALKNFSKLSIAAKSSDLKVYVAAELQRRADKGSLIIRSVMLKEHILTRLVEKADGMFRWVTCQIDDLCELYTDKQRRAALDCLPPTLPKTYDRILERVNQSSKDTKAMVQRALMRVTYAKITLTIQQLVEIVSVQEVDNHLNPESMVDEAAILKWCSSLLWINPEGKVQLSHFTVKEYLATIDPNTTGGSQSYSSAPETIVQTRLPKECFAY